MGRGTCSFTGRYLADTRKYRLSAEGALHTRGCPSV